MMLNNSFIDSLEKGANRKLNSKGGIYHNSTLSSNLDLFAFNGRFASAEEIQKKFRLAYHEDRQTALNNLLYLLDIRGGKGERRMFKEAFKALVEVNKEDAGMLLHLIPRFGRWDYLFVAMDSHPEMVIEIVREQMLKDIHEYNYGLYSNISLLVKWMPSANTSSKETRALAQKIIKCFKGMTQKQYRKTLSKLRKAIKIVENNLREKDYSFDYSKVPTKAMLKYENAFRRNDSDRYEEFLKASVSGEVKVNASVATPGELVAKISKLGSSGGSELYDAMWKNLKDIPIPSNVRALPLVDVSGSMGSLYNCSPTKPIAQALGLGLYLAERGHGTFKDKFLTFSSNPQLVKTVGTNLYEKIRNMARANWGFTTNIDKAFDLILNATLESNKADVPTHIVVISDMEFDGSGGDKTNFEHWEAEFAKHELELPKIIFWNVAANTNGYPAVKDTKNVSMISGYSTNVVENLFSLEELTPMKQMMKTLSKYNQLFTEAS